MRQKILTSRKTRTNSQHGVNHAHFLFGNDHKRDHQMKFEFCFQNISIVFGPLGYYNILIERRKYLFILSKEK